MPGGISYIQDLVIDGSEITSQSIGDKSLKTTCADSTSIEVSSTTGKLQIKEAGAARVVESPAPRWVRLRACGSKVPWWPVTQRVG